MDLARSTRDRERRPRTRMSSVVVSSALALAIAAVVTGCTAQQSASPEVAPVTPSESAAPPAGDSPPMAPPETDAHDVDPSGAASTGPEATAEAAGIAQAVLTTYATVLSELSADPAGAPVPGSTARQRWDEIVDPTSALSREVLDRVHRRATVERVVVQPGVDGVSYRHRLVAVDRVDAAAIDFSWCAWSPGIGRSLDDGAVVDDQVAHATGSGRVELSDGRWRLTRLDQLELELLPSGAADACPVGEELGG